MDIGVAFFPTDLGIDIAPLARMVEERPFYALFVAEHTHIPVSRETPHPSGDVLPPQYSHTLDPFVALSNAAAVTERIKLGTGVCLVIERDPIVTAKEVASLDRLSGGRFLFGVGAGWNREEMRNHGTDAKRRFSVMRERVEAMKEIWTKDEAEYHGEFVDFDPIWCLAQAHPEAASAGAAGRLRSEGAGPRARLRGRVDAEPVRQSGGARRLASTSCASGPGATCASSPRASSRTASWSSSWSRPGPTAAPSTSRPTPTRLRPSASWTTSPRLH